MTIFAIVLRNLMYFRGLNLAVIAGVAVATAVVSGALMVGDSVRASLTDLAIQRLGKIDHVLIAPRCFDGSLAERISADAAIKGRFEIGPAVIVRGGASMDVNSARTAGVQIIGAGGDWAPVPSNSAIINSETAAALGLQSPGSDIVFSVPTESDIPRDATLAQRSRQETLSGLRAKVSSIVTDPGMLMLFNPRGGQRTPQNAWVNLTELQGAVGRRGLVNTLFVHDGAATNDGADHLNAALRRSLRLADYGLEISPLSNGTEVALTSRSTYLGMIAELTADRVSESGRIPLRRITINLLNAVNRISEDGKVASTIHYAVAAGISPLSEAALADDEIALNQWTADRLGAKVGDRLSFTFYRRQTDGSLVEFSDAQGFPNHFRIAQILPMSGIGADSSLTPTYKGLTDADAVANWNPPAEVKIDKKLVTPADEDYWKQYKAAPKLFVSFSTARRLWGTDVGTATSIRMAADRAEGFERKLLSEINPATMGMVFRPIRQEQVAAASATTDFGQLFIGFSFFLIVAAALLVAMLLRLGVEQRGRQLGAMSAIGFGPSSLRKIMLVEGMALSVCGGVVGSFLAVIYTGLMMAGLRTWWIGAVGTTAMRMHVVPLTLVVGFVIAQIVALLAIVWAVRQIGRAAPARLLAGGWEAARINCVPNGRTNKVLGSIGLIAGLIIIIVGALGAIGQQAAFLGGGALLLASSLCLLGGLLHPHRGSEMRSLTQLAVRNGTRHNARSVLCIGLIALASFALVTVAAMRRGEPSNTGDPHSGAGGYQLIVESEIPLLGNPSKAEGRALLGFREPSNAIWNGVEFVPMRRRAGQDVSCLNITQITSPTILGVPQSLIDRGGFTADGSTHPWKLLEKTDPDGAIPIIADHSTATYILHIGVGQTLEVADASGRPRQLRLVATLSGSIFQSELLMSDEHFRAMYPAQSGFGTVLVRVAPADQEQVRRLLSDELNEYAASVRTTASLLASFLEVQNTYLSTFELLGALGLLLGTIGLAVVLVRTVIERKAELALIASLGFSRRKRLRLVLTENGFLLVTGLVLGTVCAIVGVLPAIRHSMQQINFTSLALTLVGALLTGLCASGLAVVLSGFSITPADLRRE